MTHHLHFTFGPVQGFVAQARRTRDLYAGSFLLSHLALTAMKAARSTGGSVLLPNLEAIEKLAGTTEHAIAPNRFIAGFADNQAAAQAGKAATEALAKEWQRIADVVWKDFLEPVASQGRGTSEIWNRQIPNFWEIVWVVGDEREKDLLDRRKNWRTPPATIEPGDHCTLMGDRQELSGFIRCRERLQQNAFWEAVRAQVLAAGGSELDLEDDERLCAIAFVKRFFPLVSRRAIGRNLGMENWPSTVSIAAVPWLRKIKSANPKVLRQCHDYAQLVRNEPGAPVSSARRIRALRDFPAEAGEFPRLSGNFLNHTALQNERSTPLQPGTDRYALLQRLRQIEKETADCAGNFYALLLMDGDSMGRMIRQHTPQKVTSALSALAQKTPEIVADHDGVCIYAGGDDLLAMLPLDRALDASAAVRNAYRAAFAAQAISGEDGTISGGLVFAHYRCAFSRVLGYAHQLLDEVAKESAGRDAIAIGVLKPGGVVCQWCGKFDSFLANGAHCFTPLITAYEKEREGKVGSLSSSFLYNLRERFAELFGGSGGRTQDSGEFPFELDTLKKLFVAEYLHDKIKLGDLAKAAQHRQQAEALIGQLLKVCEQPRSRFSLDGVRLIRFLALEGKEGAE